MQRGRLGGMLLAGAVEPQIESQVSLPVPLFQFVPRSDPAGCADVCALPAVAAKRRGPAILARYRPVLWNRADVVEPVWTSIR